MKNSINNNDSNTIAIGILKGLLLLGFFPISLIFLTKNPKKAGDKVAKWLLIYIIISLIISFIIITFGR